ncbi:MAG: polysaccharide deacetylase family protein [Chloroflexota bacterium]|jgi:peptidoglycan/xylan/chitin deacetylase (PgdA/CDA1 family)
MSRSVLSRALVLALVLSLLALVPAEAASARIIKAAPRSTGAVALTFDDGWNHKACSQIADILRARNVTGTFFINGRELEKRPWTWRRILEGMPVGNHTYAHKRLTGLANDAIRRQLQRNENVHERILGRPMLKLFRPPYGVYSDRVRRVAAEAGYRRMVLWNVQPHDWSPETTARQIVKRATGARRGSIILLHCRYGATVKALPRIIRHYKERGIRLVGLDELLDR